MSDEPCLNPNTSEVIGPVTAIGQNSVFVTSCLSVYCIHFCTCACFPIFVESTKHPCLPFTWTSSPAQAENPGMYEA